MLAINENSISEFILKKEMILAFPLLYLYPQSKI